MKKLTFLCAVATLIVSCNTREMQDQRCKGILLDSLTNLSKYRDRVVCLENGACGQAKEYQERIAELENIVDSLNKLQQKTRLKQYASRSKKKAKKAIRIIHVVKYEAKPPADVKPFYFDDVKQKYFFYDAKRNAYYSIDPVNRERHYNN